MRCSVLPEPLFLLCCVMTDALLALLNSVVTTLFSIFRLIYTNFGDFKELAAARLGGSLTEDGAVSYCCLAENLRY